MPACGIDMHENAALQRRTLDLKQISVCHCDDKRQKMYSTAAHSIVTRRHDLAATLQSGAVLSSHGGCFTVPLRSDSPQPCRQGRQPCGRQLFSLARPVQLMMLVPLLDGQCGCRQLCRLARQPRTHQPVDLLRPVLLHEVAAVLQHVQLQVRHVPVRPLQQVLAQRRVAVCI